MSLHADALLEEIFYVTAGLPPTDRLVAALDVLHGVALESSYPASGAWASLITALITTAREGEQANERAAAEADARGDEAEINRTVQEIAIELTGRCGALPYVKDEEGIAFIVAVDEDADRLSRYIKRYWRRT